MLQEDPYVGGGKLDGFSDADGVNVYVVRGEHPQQFQLGVGGQGGVYFLFHWGVY